LGYARRAAAAGALAAIASSASRSEPTTGALRSDVTHLDIDVLLESLATIKLGNAERSAELRQRHLIVIIDGLSSAHPTPLPGKSPSWEEQSARWVTR
jgi:hypothetical protein